MTNCYLEFSFGAVSLDGLLFLGGLIVLWLLVVVACKQS